MKKKIKCVTTIFKNFGLRPYKPSVAVAVAEGAKPSATAVEIRPSVDLWEQLLKKFKNAIFLGIFQIPAVG